MRCHQAQAPAGSGPGQPHRLWPIDQRRSHSWPPRLATTVGRRPLRPSDCNSYKLGVSRLFLKHRAAEQLNRIGTLDPARLEFRVRDKVSECCEAAERICRHLVSYWHKRQWRKFFEGVITLQKTLRMWLAYRRYRRIVAGAVTAQGAVRAHIARRRCHAAVRVQAAVRAMVEGPGMGQHRWPWHRQTLPITTHKAEARA